MNRLLFAFFLVALMQVSVVSEASSGTSSESAEFKFTIDSSSRYTLKGDVATSQDFTGVVTIEIKSVANGKEQAYVFGPVEATEPLNETLTVLDNQVHVFNEKERYDLTLRAEVNRRFLTRNVSSIVIPKAEVMRAMGAALAKRGQELLSRLSVSVEGVSLDLKLETSDLVCAAGEEDLLTCKLSTQIVLKAKN